MPKRNFPVYDFAANGIRLMLENIRLFVLTALAALGTLLATLGVMALVAHSIFMSLWNMMPVYREQFMTCSSGNECSNVAISMWREITPLLTSNFLMIVFCGLLAFVVFTGLTLGFFRIVLDVVEKGTSRVSRLFCCFHLVPKFLVSAFIVSVATSVGLIFFIIPGVFLLLRLRFFYYYIVDKEAGIIECLKKSYHATRGLEWNVLALSVVGVVLMQVTVFIGVPAAFLMVATAYRKLPKTKK